MPNGEVVDFDALLSQHGESTWRLIVRVLGDNGADAADCFQQAFAEMVERHRKSNTHRILNAGALLKKIAASRAIDVIRRRVRERDRSSSTQTDVISCERSLEPDAIAENNEFLNCFREVLAELPEAQSTAFVMTQVDGISNEEAANAIGVTTEYLGVLLHRGRLVLRDRLKPYRSV